MLRRFSRIKRALLVATAASLAAVSLAACILAEEPAELPPTPLTRPTILHGSVVPSTSTVLGTFPEKFIVPVELSDPTLSFQWATFVDYNALTGTGLVDLPRTSTFEAATTQGRVRTLEVTINPPPSTDGCHVIEVVVALRFASPSEPHVPSEPGGDVVTWFYSPGGDLSGCPVVDAGIDATIDAGEAGPQ
ncbi:hypothetical protein AKJ09_09638 [Labilithrix luteola]|uniref:Lipoprotein n=2 Tax=Labilithrix luteola TaxID=1391654 RepID=A0A0K1QC15_9BACT|nr:hypothetical protein AKJ09_09638 [Labilithrix luteola]